MVVAAVVLTWAHKAVEHLEDPVVVVVGLLRKPVALILLGKVSPVVLLMVRQITVPVVVVAQALSA